MVLPISGTCWGAKTVIRLVVGEPSAAGGRSSACGGVSPIGDAFLLFVSDDILNSLAKALPPHPVVYPRPRTSESSLLDSMLMVCSSSIAAPLSTSCTAPTTASVLSVVRMIAASRELCFPA